MSHNILSAGRAGAKGRERPEGIARMKTLIALLLFSVPAFAGVKEDPKLKPYKTLAGELLENCEGSEKKIAVATFNYLDGRQSDDGYVISERITTELVRLRKFRVTERKEIEKVLTELKLQRSGAIGDDSVKSIGKMLGADWMALGTLAELSGRQIEINARLVGVESGEIINAYSVKVKKDWRDKPKEDITEETELRDKDELKEYDKAILKYMDDKIVKKGQDSSSFGYIVSTHPVSNP